MRRFLWICSLMCSTLAAEDTLAPPVPQSIYDVSVQSMDGSTGSLSIYKGWVMLVVNVWPTDKNSNQMGQLQEIFDKYTQRGFVVLAFPSNDFSHSKPLTNLEIQASFQENYKVNFPVLSQVHVLGTNKSPLYAFLTNTRSDPKYGFDITWNYTKFLIDRTGKVIGRFGTTTPPNDPKLIGAIEKALAEQ